MKNPQIPLSTAADDRNLQARAYMQKVSIT